MQEIRSEGVLLARDFFVGTSDRAIYGAMEKRARDVGPREKGVTIYRTKIGRNATCPCGSGRKFKRCCMANAIQV